MKLYREWWAWENEAREIIKHLILGDLVGHFKDSWLTYNEIGSHWRDQTVEKYSLNKIQVWLPCAENNEMASSEGKRPVKCCHSSQVKQVRQILLTEISLDCSYQYGDLNESSFSVMIKKTQNRRGLKEEFELKTRKW